MSYDGYITSKDLSGKKSFTGIARKEAEEQKKYKKLLDIAIAKVEEEREKALIAESELKKKKEPKKKKST